MTRHRLPVGGLSGFAQVVTTARLVRTRLRAVRHDRRGATDLALRTYTAVWRSGQQATISAGSVQSVQEWTDSGVRLARGDTVTVLAAGTLWAARRLGLGMPPAVGLWLRSDSGAITSMLGTAMTFTADATTSLRFCAAEPGVFDESGAFDTSVRHLRLSGSFQVVVVQWHGDPAAALTAAAESDPELFGPAVIRSRAPARTPRGWGYHPRAGQAEIFTQGQDGSEIDCVTRGDSGILRHPVDIEITEELALTWSWLVDALPSRLAEDIEPTHDYLSVAVEFDDGRDLSWIWSSELPVGSVFTCPLEYWRDRETHLVVRSGTRRLGQWITECRPIARDLRHALDPPHPRRIVAIWLIANSVFQQGIGRCSYRGPRLHSLAAQQKVAP